MDKNQLQNIFLSILAIFILIGAGFQFIKNQSISVSNPSNLAVAKNSNLKSEGSEGMEGSHNDEPHSHEDHKNEDSNNISSLESENNIDHSDPKNQRRMGIFHYNEGNKLLTQEKWKEAIGNYQMALKHDEKLFEVYINLSVAYFRIEDYDKAYLTLQKLKTFQPNNPSLYYNLACYYSLTDRIEFGKVAIQKSVQLGFKNFQSLKTDQDLKNLKNDSAYNLWLETL